eukprot:TRINITY_DN20628_c0_g1_i1.p1 TRINITY_DN20628_c0_g1~~TRINITY_DN20628_c0_g1_i1.p1  ORF type:complete len:439 (+),score=52.02 TRINITY_DN20628_c0_g1_i1:87-1403(+)
MARGNNAPSTYRSWMLGTTTALLGLAVYLEVDRRRRRRRQLAQPQTPSPDIEDLGTVGCRRPLLSPSPMKLEPLGEPAPLYVSPVKQIHLELTSKCNASCPQCARNVNGGRVNPRLPLTELSVDKIKMILEPLLPTLDRVMLCGNYGDPTAARDCLHVLRYLRRAKPSLIVALHTNGGARSPVWWEEVGRLLQSPSFCRFAIDGLEDTNHLYRQHVAWDRLIDNVTAFISAGGRAEQDFLVFRHNEHQIDEARALAKRLGITKFIVKRTRRFVDKETGSLRPFTRVEDRQGNVVGQLQPPINSEWRNEADMYELRAVLDRHGSIDRYYDTACIECRSRRNAEVYISAEALIFPCCFLAGELYNSRSGQQLSEVLGVHGESLEGLRVTPSQSVEEVLNSPLYTHIVAASWTKASVHEGKLRTCSANCGTEYLGFEKQWR